MTDTLSCLKIAYFIGAGEFMTHSQSRSTRDIRVSQPGVSVRLGNGHVGRLYCSSTIDPWTSLITYLTCTPLSRLSRSAPPSPSGLDVGQSRYRVGGRAVVYYSNVPAPASQILPRRL